MSVGFSHLWDAPLQSPFYSPIGCKSYLGTGKGGPGGTATLLSMALPQAGLRIITTALGHHSQSARSLPHVSLLPGPLEATRLQCLWGGLGSLCKTPVET